MGSHKYVLKLPADWHPLDGETEGEHRAFADLVANFEVDVATASRLLIALDSVWSAASSSKRNGGRTWALVRDPQSGNVDAILTSDIRVLTEGFGFDKYLDLVTESAKSTDSLEVVNRTFLTTQLPAGPAIVVHDFVLPLEMNGVQDPATERVICAIFPLGWNVMAEFAVVTQNLVLSTDLAADVLPIFATFEVLSETEAIRS